MPVFQSTDEMYRIMGELFERIATDEETSAGLVDGELVLRFRWRNPEGESTVDLRQHPVRYTLGPSELDPDVELTQDADIAHRFWMGRLNVPQAIATRKVIARGSVAKALKLLPAIRPAFAMYTDVLQDMDRYDLVPADPVERKLPWWQRLVLRRRRSTAPVEVAEDWGIQTTEQPVVLPTIGADGEPTPVDRDERALAMLRQMMYIRAFEMHLSKAYADGELPTEVIHLSIGQEATAVGTCMALDFSDTIATTHRGHGHMLAKGADPYAMLAEIYGRGSGLCGGKGGSMHVTQSTVGALGANGIVGASTLIATGAALAAKLEHELRVSLAFLGDGATNQGMVHEALNLAAVFELPVVFVVENNQYGEFTPLERHTKVARLADRADAYGMPGFRVDGNDVEEVYETVFTAVERARQGDGPSLVECLTYRFHGHMEGEQAQYRSREEVASWKELDPILLLSKRLELRQVISDEAISEMRTEVEDDLTDTARRARSAQDPDLASVSDHIFAPEPSHLYTPAPTPAKTREVSYAVALWEALSEEMDADDSVFLLGVDVTHGGFFSVTNGLEDKYQGRVLDTPISENAIVGAAVGAAIAGRRPVAEILFSDFLTCCMDPIINQAAKLRYMSGGQYALPLVIRTPGGAGLGMAAQHSQSLEPLLTGVPGLIVIAPGTAADAKGLLKSAIRSSNPVVFFENKLLYLHTDLIPDGEYTVPIGKAAVHREGCDATVVAVGSMVPQALVAADTLSREGIEIEVVDPRTLIPLDTQTIVSSVAKTGRLVTAEEAPRTHGFGAEIAARVLEYLPPSRLKSPIRRVGADHVPIPYARNLERAVVPDEDAIRDAVRVVLRT